MKHPFHGGVIFPLKVKPVIRRPRRGGLKRLSIKGLIRDEATQSVPLRLGMKHLLIAQESGLEPLKQTLSCPSSLSAESAEVFFLVAFCLCQESQIRSFRNGTISPRILTSFPLKARLPDLGCISNKTAMINEQIQMRLNWEITNVNAGTQED